MDGVWYYNNDNIEWKVLIMSVLFLLRLQAIAAIIINNSVESDEGKVAKHKLILENDYG